MFLKILFTVKIKLIEKTWLRNFGKIKENVKIQL